MQADGRRATDDGRRATGGERCFLAKEHNDMFHFSSVQFSIDSKPGRTLLAGHLGQPSSPVRRGAFFFSYASSSDDLVMALSRTKQEGILFARPG